MRVDSNCIWFLRTTKFTTKTNTINISRIKNINRKDTGRFFVDSVGLFRSVTAERCPGMVKTWVRIRLDHIQIFLSYSILNLFFLVWQEYFFRFPGNL